MKHDWVCNESYILTTYPPKYNWYCKRCGKVTTRFCSEGPPIDDEECPGGDGIVLDGSRVEKNPTMEMDKLVICRDGDTMYGRESDLKGNDRIVGAFLKDGTYKMMDKIFNETKESNETPDKVNHPSHYTTGRIECIEAIRESMTTVEYKGYLKGNVLKYLWRYQLKENPKEDLKKAAWYLDRLIGLE